MGIYTYAVIDSAQAVEPSLGLFGMPVHNLPCRRLGVVVSELPEGDCPRMGTVPKTLRTAERILEHSAVTDRLMTRFTVLPIRFGTIFPDRDRVIANAEEHYADFCSNLDRLRAKVEFGLRVLWPGEAIRQEIESEVRSQKSEVRSEDKEIGENGRRTAAKQFMEAKLATYRLDQAFTARAEQAIAEIDRAFHLVAAEKRCERLKTPNLLLSAYYLVEKALLGDFRAACQRLKHQRPEFKYLLSGPWPPYNFVVMPPQGAAVRPEPCDACFGLRAAPSCRFSGKAGAALPHSEASDAGGVQ